VNSFQIEGYDPRSSADRAYRIEIVPSLNVTARERGLADISSISSKGAILRNRIFRVSSQEATMRKVALPDRRQIMLNELSRATSVM
jgi:hypothetical protein